MTARSTRQRLRSYSLTALLALFFALLSLFGFRLIMTVGELTTDDLARETEPPSGAFSEPHVPDFAEKIVLVSTDSTVSIKYLFDGTELYYIRSKSEPSDKSEGGITAVIGGVEAKAELRSDGINRIYFEYGREHHILYGRLGLIELCESASGIIRG